MGTTYDPKISTRPNAGGNPSSKILNGHPIQRKVTPDPLTKLVDGFPLPTAFTDDYFRQALRMEIKPSDVIVSTYPKCGTTWTQYIIWGLYNEGAPPPDFNEMSSRGFPFIELMGLEALQGLKDPRLLKFHLPYNMVPKAEGARLIHVLRNPFDAVVSFWNHMREIHAKPAEIDYPFDNFFEHFISGKGLFGDYFQHEISWFEHRHDKNLLYLTFEGMKKDSTAAILTISDFLGFGERIRSDHALREKVLLHSSFNYMKENCQYRIFKNKSISATMGEDYRIIFKDRDAIMNDKLCRDSNFFRKGKVGGAKEQLSADQWQRLERAIQENVANPELRALMMQNGH